MDWVRASCMKPRLKTPTAPAHGNSHSAGITSHRFATIMRTATMLAAAKKGASWAREISWTSRSGELSDSASCAARPADSPPGRRAETKRLYLSGASYIRPPFHVWEAAYPKRVEAQLRGLRFAAQKEAMIINSS